MAEYCASKSFSATSCAYIDAVCRFSDGAGADRYSLWEFLSGFDQHIRPFYIPKKSNDFLFETWHAYLEKRGVDIFVDADVTRVSRTSGKSNYHFTSMEAAVQNAMAYLDMRPASPWHASDAVRWALVGSLAVVAARRILKT